MKSKIHILDYCLFDQFLSGLTKFINSAEFNFHADGCDVYTIDENSVNRLIYRTNCVKSDNNVSICLSNISKFHKAYNICKTYNDNFDLIYDGPYLRVSNKLQSSFKIQVSCKDVIEKYVKGPLKSELIDSDVVMINNDKLRELRSLLFIDDNSEYKLYLYKKDGIIMGCIDDKESDLSENIVIPLQDNTSEINGDWLDTIVVPIDSIQYYNLINANEIKIAYTEQCVLSVKTEICNDAYYINSHIISSVINE